jgi:hypothetical protein
MERDDLERCVAELERQLAEQRRYAGATRGAGSGGQLWSSLTGDRRLSVLAVLGISLVAAMLVTLLIPSSALWKRDRLRQWLSPGIQRELRSWAGNDQDVPMRQRRYLVWRQQTRDLRAAGLGRGARGSRRIAAARLTWRRSRMRWLAIAVLALGLLVPLALELAVVGKWQDSSGPIQVPHGGSLSVDELFTTKSIACNDGDLRVGGFFMTVTVSGHCRRLTVDGIGDYVTFDTVDLNIGGGIAITVEHR